jgi:tRNA threonylcarbamoyladenosine biosynthesis protein TsaB
MALILNLETATTVCSISLAKDGLLLALKEQHGDYSHSENLTVFIEHVVQEAGYKLSDVDAIAVSKGPGSYTGLRIGVSTAKGLCYSLNKPLLAINTLQYLALSVSKNLAPKISDTNSLFCPMLDARRMEVYCALYDNNNKCVMPVSALIIDENSFQDITNPIYFFGDGAEKCKEVLSKNKNAIFIDNIFPSAKNMIPLSEQAYMNKAFEDVAYFEPFYLKDFIAGKKKLIS